MSPSDEKTDSTSGEALPGRASLWSRLVNPASPEDFFSGWLALQSSLLRSCVRSVLITGASNAASYAPVARWPEGEDAVDRLADIAERAIEERCGLVTELPAQRAPRKTGHDGQRFGVAYPIQVEESLYGVVAVEVAAVHEDDLQNVMEQLQWGVASLQFYFCRREMNEGNALHARLTSAVDLLAAVLAEESFTEASMAFVTGLAAQFGCDRASLGFLRNDKIHIEAISHSAHFDRRTRFNRTVSRAMEEAILQAREVVFPPPSGDELMIVRDHEEIIRQFGAESILTLPLYGNGKYYGAVTLERKADLPFCKEEIDICRSIFSLAAPALAGKRIQSRPLVFHILHSLKSETRKLLGPGHVVRKLIAGGAVALILFFSFVSGDYRVTAGASLEGAVRRTIAAPYQGYIKEAFARAGDTVPEGKVICSLDQRDLLLEKSNLQGQQTQLIKQQQEAMALRDLAKLNVLAAQLDQVLAQINLNANKLSRSSIRAPFDGVLVSGDLSQKLGAAVEQGAPLFEIAPLTDYRLILQVSENDIAEIKVGQTGNLVLPSLSELFDFTVEKITPMTTALEGKNCFRVEARLNRTSKSLRPGMEGVGKINIDRRKLIAIWTKPLGDWLRLWVWTWWP